MSAHSHGSAGLFRSGPAQLFSAGLSHVSVVSGQVSGRVEQGLGLTLRAGGLVGQGASARRAGLCSTWSRIPRGPNLPPRSSWREKPRVFCHLPLARAKPGSSGEGRRPPFAKGRRAGECWRPPSPVLLKRRVLRPPEARLSALRFRVVPSSRCPSVHRRPRPQGGLAKGEAPA